MTQYLHSYTVKVPIWDCIYMSLWTIAQLNVQSSYLRLYLNDFVNHDTVFAQLHGQSSYMRLYLYEFVDHSTVKRSEFLFEIVSKWFCEPWHSICTGTRSEFLFEIVSIWVCEPWHIFFAFWVCGPWHGCICTVKRSAVLIRDVSTLGHPCKLGFKLHSTDAVGNRKIQDIVLGVQGVLVKF